MSPLPNFLVIGAAKSGTTALYHYLKQHQQIYMSPVKEPCFFAFEGEVPHFCGPGDDVFNRMIVTRLEDYSKLVDAVHHQVAVGEASPQYLMFGDSCAKRIQCHIPHTRLIAVLRQPADRAYSYYMMLVSPGRERLSFAQALDAEGERKRMNWAPGWQYRAHGFYYRLLQPYFDRFPREQIRIYLYEDWNAKPLEVLQDILRFLQVDDTFIPKIARHNVTWLPRSRAIQKFLTKPHALKSMLKLLLPQSARRGMISRLQSFNLTKPPPLDPKLRRQLTEEYRDDIVKLQELIGRDLSHWLEI
jgi:hypothetical protein